MRSKILAVMLAAALVITSVSPTITGASTKNISSNSIQAFANGGDETQPDAFGISGEFIISPIESGASEPYALGNEKSFTATVYSGNNGVGKTIIREISITGPEGGVADFVWHYNGETTWKDISEYNTTYVMAGNEFQTQFKVKFMNEGTYHLEETLKDAQGRLYCSMNRYIIISNGTLKAEYKQPEEPTTTEAATTTVAEPTTTVVEPVTTAAEPTTTDVEPVTTAAEPTTTVVEPVTTAAEPVTTVVEPATTVTEPVTTEAESATTVTEPVTTEAEPVTTVAEPVTTEAEPVTTVAPTEKPTTVKPPVVTTTKKPIVTTKVVAPVTAKISKATAGKKKVSLKLKKISGVKGFKIQYSTNKKFKKVTTKMTTKTSYTIKKLKSKKKYYFRAKAYKVVNGKKVYSKKWSSVKTVKVK